MILVRCLTVANVDSIGLVVRRWIQCSAGYALPHAGRAGSRRCRAAPPARRPAARRRCRTPPSPAPRPGSPDRAGQRRWPPLRRARPPGTAPAPWRPRTASPAAPAAVHQPGQPVQRRPVGAPGGRRAAGQAGHAERLDHVIIQQELPAGRDPPRRGEPAQPAHRRASHGLPPRFGRIAREHRGAHTCLPAQ